MKRYRENNQETVCCGKNLVYWYHISDDHIKLFCANWKPHYTHDFIRLGEI